MEVLGSMGRSHLKLGRYVPLGTSLPFAAAPSAGRRCIDGVSSAFADAKEGMRVNCLRRGWGTSVERQFGRVT